MSKPVLIGDRVELRPIQADDAERLRVIRASPEVTRWWSDPDTVRWPFDRDGSETRAVWMGDQIVGFIEWYEHLDPEYRHAGMDIFLSADARGRGLGREVVSVVIEHLVASGHHRIVIDPATANTRAIACYEACGFRPVGVMRKYERDNDGAGWHDGLLMEYVVDG